MNAKTYLAVSIFSLFAAASAFAAEGTQDFGNDIASSKTRAEVRAETVAAARAGLIESGEASRGETPVSTLLRARVQAEANEASRLGLIGPSETLPQPTAAQLEQIRTAGERAVATVFAAVK
jgi:hypothetical protein